MQRNAYPAAVTVVSLWLLMGVVETCTPATRSSDGLANARTWERMTLFDGKGYAWLHAARKVSDGYVVVGVDDHKGLLIKLDGDGVKQWVRRYAYTEHDELYCAKETKDGGYILAGMASGERENDGLLVKTSSDGKEQWHRLLRGKCNRLYGVDETQGGYVLAGSTTGNEFGYVVKTDAQGKIVADAVLGTDDSRSVFHSISQIDGGFLVTGYTDAGDRGQGWVLELNHALRERRQKVYKDGRRLCLSSSLPVPAGGYLLAGMVRSDGYRACLMKVSKSLEKQWEITLKGGNNELYPSLFRDEMGRCNILSGNGSIRNTWISRICSTAASNSSEHAPKAPGRALKPRKGRFARPGAAAGEVNLRAGTPQLLTGDGLTPRRPRGPSSAGGCCRPRFVVE